MMFNLGSEKDAEGFPYTVDTNHLSYEMEREMTTDMQE